MESPTPRAVRDRKRPEPDELTRKERAAEPPPVDTDDPVELADADSFPASDPPSFTPSRAGRPSDDPVDDLP